MTVYPPEGIILDTLENKQHMNSIAALKAAMALGIVLEERVLVCDNEHNLILNLGCCKGIIPRVEGAMGIEDGTTRDIAIISRVGKPVSFIVTKIQEDAEQPLAILSRRKAQQACKQEYLDTLRLGDIIPVRATHLESFGCFVDVGCGITSLIPIDAISISRISHPRDRFRAGQDLLAVVRHIDADGRITLSHKELLGSWEENAARFSAGETVAGIIRSVEAYGVFVELTPNLAGLAELREAASPGQHASIYIKSLIPEKMKIKLIIVDAFDAPSYTPPSPEYCIQSGRISYWRYSPENCERIIETVFE